MNRIACLLAVACLLGAIGCATGDDVKDRPADGPGASPNELTAERVKSAPALKPVLGPAWQTAAPLTVETTLDADAGPTVTLRALHDGEFLYLLAEWDDETKSDVKKAWSWGGDAWDRRKGDEDRIAIAFNIDSAEFDRRGCNSLCHDGAFYVTEPGARVDMWHWKAARGGQHSHADDQYVTSDRDDARQNDDGRGAYTVNEHDVENAPLRVWNDDADTAGPFNAETARPLPAGFAPEEGYGVPSYLLRTPEGSRADVESRGAWKDGRWTVVFRRRLDTGQPDDARFAAGETVTFAISTFDDTGATTGDEHAVSAPQVLRIR